MKKMKKFVALAAVASLAAATFAGCGKSEGSGSSNTGSDAVSYTHLTLPTKLEV